MISLFFPSFITLGYFLIERFWLNRKHTNLFYAYMFIILAALSFLSHSEAREPNPESRRYDVKLTQAQRELFFNLSVMKAQQGYRFLSAAENECMWIPNIDKRETTKEVIRNMMATLAVSEIKTKAVVLCLAFLATYLENIYDTYQEIESLLLEAQSCFESSEFYEDLLLLDTLNYRNQE